MKRRKSEQIRKMVLNDKEILQCLEYPTVKRGIIISPFDSTQLNNTSYDVRLGEWIYRRSKSTLLNLADERSRKGFWQAVPEKCVNYIELAPGETILAHTNEFIGGYGNITTMMKAKSTMGRNCISVCKDAGWGDVGYFNRWTLEITNFDTIATIQLPIGMKLAQIIFFNTGSDVLSSYENLGSYQESSDIDLVIKNWKPEHMLPHCKPLV